VNTSTTGKADRTYISDALGVEDQHEAELTVLMQQLFTGGLTPDEYEAKRAVITTRAAVRLAEARRRHHERSR
jgi:hypothetical protein